MEAEELLEQIMADCTEREDMIAIDVDVSDKPYFIYSYITCLDIEGLDEIIYDIAKENIKNLNQNDIFQILSVLLNLKDALKQENNCFRSRYAVSNYLIRDGFRILCEIKKATGQTLFWDVLSFGGLAIHRLRRQGARSYEIDINRDFSLTSVLSSHSPIEALISFGKIAMAVSI